MADKELKEGDTVRLKPDKFPTVKIRTWYIDKFEGDKLLLRCFFAQGYTLLVEKADIEVIREKEESDLSYST